MIMETPSLPVTVQERMRKEPIQYGDSPSPMDFGRVADVLNKDETIPLHLRTIIALLV